MLRERFLLLALLVQVGQLTGQVTIADARAMPLGSTVTVTGIVTNGSELGGIRYLQDSTAGIAAFPGTGSVGGFFPQPGHEITISGELILFNGLLEIDPITSYQVLATGQTLPEPLTITPMSMGPDNEGMLVRFPDAQFADAGGNFTSGTWSFNSAGESGVVFFRNGHPILGSPIPDGVVELTGIVSRYTTSTPPVGGYQVLPRSSADLAPSTTIHVVGDVDQTDITSDGFTLRWQTDQPGSSMVAYGPTTDLGNFTGTMAEVEQHAVTIDGLGPASFHHARVFSVQGTDTAFSPIRYYSTASATEGSIAVYFNKNVETAVALYGDAIHIPGAMDDTLRAYMDRAETSLDVAVYNTTNNSLVNAANDAHDRGVLVRWIAEASNSNSALPGLHPDIPVLYRTDGGGSGMHNKFMVVDADADDAWVLSSSANFTNAGLFLDANNLMVVRDAALARCYRMEFEEMWGGSGAQPDPQNSRFGAEKLDNTPHLFNVGGTPVRSYFSPSDGTTARIREALLSAQSDVRLALFAFTNSSLADAVLDRHAAPGVDVRALLNDAEEPGSVYGMLADAGVNVLPWTAESGTVHHKYAIIDHGEADPLPLVINGSHNWSFFAENLNDENTLFIQSAAIADQFHQEWTARWDQVVGIAQAGGGTAPLTVWPNPASGALWLRLVSLTRDDVRAEVYDMQGRLVLQHHMGAMPGIREERIPLDGLPTGTYVLHVHGGGPGGRVRFVHLP